MDTVIHTSLLRSPPLSWIYVYIDRDIETWIENGIRCIYVGWRSFMQFGRATREISWRDFHEPTLAPLVPSAFYVRFSLYTLSPLSSQSLRIHLCSFATLAPNGTLPTLPTIIIHHPLCPCSIAPWGIEHLVGRSRMDGSRGWTRGSIDPLDLSISRALYATIDMFPLYVYTYLSSWSHPNFWRRIVLFPVRNSARKNFANHENIIIHTGRVSRVGEADPTARRRLTLSFYLSIYVYKYYHWFYVQPRLLPMSRVSSPSPPPPISFDSWHAARGTLHIIIYDWTFICSSCYTSTSPNSLIFITPQYRRVFF